MKLVTRLVISIILFTLGSIALPLLIIFVKNPNFSPAIYVFSYILLLIGIGTFFWGGLTKIFINTTYILLTILFLYTFPTYDIAIIITGSALFMLNPYKFMENIFSKNLCREREKSYYKLVSKKNQEYFLYHQEMKKFFHMKSYIMLYKNFFYRFIRYSIPAMLYGAASFFSFYRLKSFLNFTESLTNYYDNLLFWFVSIVVILITAMIIQYKGFSSAFRFLLFFIFPYMFYIIYHIVSFPKNDMLIKYFILAACILGLIVVIAVQIPYYYQRVIYYTYNYFDNKNGQDVYANGLYEKNIIKEGHQRHGIYLMNMALADFQYKFKWLLIYCNYNKIIITAYTYKQNEIKLYCVFRTDKKKQPKKMLNYLSRLFKNKSIILNQFVDKESVYLNELFINTENYLVAKAIKDANLLKEFGLRKPVVISLFANFKEHRDMIEFAREKKINIYDLSNLDSIAEIRMMLPNDNNAIELAIRDIYASLIFHNVLNTRVVVRYSIAKVNNILVK